MFRPLLNRHEDFCGSGWCSMHGHQPPPKPKNHIHLEIIHFLNKQLTWKVKERTKLSEEIKQIEAELTERREKQLTFNL